MTTTFRGGTALRFATVGLLLGAGGLATASSGVDTGNFDAAVPVGTDYYRHINGGWLTRTAIPADRSNYGSFSELDDRAREQLRTILEEAVAADAPAGSRSQKLGALYAAFMDTATVEKRGAAPLEKDLQYIDVALGDHDDLARVMGKLSTLGVKLPFGGYVGRDAKNPDVEILYLAQWGLGLPDRDYYLSSDAQFAGLRKAYVSYMTRMLTLIGTPDAARVAARVLAFETRLAEKQWTRVESRDAVKRYNPYTPEKLSVLSSSFDFAASLAAADVPSSTVIVSQPSYFEALGPILQDTDLATLREYLRLRTTETFAPYLSAAFVDTAFDFYGRTLSGTTENEPRWKRGIAAVEDAAGFLLGEEYVARHYPDEAARRMDAMVQNLIRAYAASIRELEWMGEETKQQALEKLSKFRPKVGKPPTWRNYDALMVSASDLYGNMRRAALFEHNRQISKIGQAPDPHEWHMTPQTVNAYYNPTANEIVFPAAILQPPFFNVEADDAVNYGAIGAVIGHEIGHGFDDQGSRYDGDGNLRNWWTDADRERFEAQTRILIEQYNAYEALPGQYVNGALTIGENIGDIGGLSIAYDAWLLSLDGKEPETIENMSGAQRFFSGWAQIWRRLYREPELLKRLKSDPHAPSEFRVNGVVVHIPAFYEAYEIDDAAPLYRSPEQRVTIW